MYLSLIRNSDEDHSCLNPGVSIGWQGEQHEASKDALKGQKWLTCFTSREQTHPASYTPWPVTGRSKACPLGPGGRAVLSCESRVYFAKLSSSAHSPTPRFTRFLRTSLVPPPNHGGEWRSHSTPRLLYLIFNHAVKEFSFQSAPDPCCPPHPHSPAHSHTWIPAIGSLVSELKTHTPISSSPSTFHLSNSHFRIFYALNPAMVPTSSGQTPNSSIRIPACSWSSRGDPPQPQVSPFLPSQW